MKLISASDEKKTEQKKKADFLCNSRKQKVEALNFNVIFVCFLYAKFEKQTIFITLCTFCAWNYTNFNLF